MMNAAKPVPARKPRARSAGAPAVTRKPRWKVLQAADGRWFYLFVGANGEPMSQSTEFWERKSDANRGRDDARRAAKEAE